MLYGKTEGSTPFRPAHTADNGIIWARLSVEIGVGMSGDRAQPGIYGIDGFRHGREVTAMNDLLDQTQLLVSHTGIGVPDGSGCCDIGHAGDVSAEFMQGHVSIERLVGRIGVHQRRLLVGHHLLKDRSNRFALGKPLAADFSEEPHCVRLIHQDDTGGTTVREREPVHFVVQARRRRGRETDDRVDAQMLIAKARLHSAGQGLVV